MASQGRECRGRPQGASQAPPVFDQQAFIEAMSAAFASFAHTSAAGGQRGQSNLQRFKTHHPPTFTGGGDLIVADHWFRHIEKILETMEITSDATKISVTAFYVTPQTRGSVDYPSTRGIQVDVGLPDATSENRAESPLYGELYPNTTPA